MQAANLPASAAYSTVAHVTPRNQWLLRLAISLISLMLLLSTGIRRGWLK